MGCEYGGVVLCDKVSVRGEESGRAGRAGWDFRALVRWLCGVAVVRRQPATRDRVCTVCE